MNKVMNKFLAITLLTIPAAVFAQQKAPIAQYWMSVETSAGMSMPGMGGMAGLAWRWALVRKAGARYS